MSVEGTDVGYTAAKAITSPVAVVPENDELDEEKLHEPKKKQLEYVNFIQKKFEEKCLEAFYKKFCQ